MMQRVNSNGAATQAAGAAAGSQGVNGKRVFQEFKRQMGEGGDSFARRGAEATKSVGKDIMGRVWNGVKRTMIKSLRPRAILIELPIMLFTAGAAVPLFLGKHFVEGFMRANSLFLKRRIPMPISNTVSKVEHETVVDAIKALVGGK